MCLVIVGQVEYMRSNKVRSNSGISVSGHNRFRFSFLVFVHRYFYLHELSLKDYCTLILLPVGGKHILSLKPTDDCPGNCRISET